MRKNIGLADRVIRLIIAVVLVVIYSQDLLPGIWNFVFLAGAAIMSLTAIIRACPLYLPFRINTMGKSEIKKTTSQTT